MMWIDFKEMPLSLWNFEHLSRKLWISNY